MILFASVQVSRFQIVKNAIPYSPGSKSQLIATLNDSLLLLEVWKIKISFNVRNKAPIIQNKKKIKKSHSPVHICSSSYA